jgi:hypothetical protein
MRYDSSMKTRMFLASVMLAALTLPLPAAAATPAPTMASCPITIRSLEITEPIVDPDRGRHPGTDDITFRNARTVAASHVTFAFYAKQNFVKSAVTKGLFSPGIDIQKQFPDTSNVVITSVVVTKAVFADGTVCHNRNNTGAVTSKRKSPTGSKRKG